jgi:hypothetical protein
MSLKPGQRKVEQLLKQDHGSRRPDEELRQGSFVGIGGSKRDTDAAPDLIS